MNNQAEWIVGYLNFGGEFVEIRRMPKRTWSWSDACSVARCAARNACQLDGVPRDGSVEVRDSEQPEECRIRYRLR